MKKIFFLAGIVMMLFLASCAKSHCPTYDNNTGNEKYSGGKRSNVSKGLFPKNM